MNYNNLRPYDKGIVNNLINAKQAVIKSEQLYNSTVNSAFKLLREHQAITMGTVKITYTEAKAPSYEFNKKLFAKEYPDLYRKYSTKLNNGVREKITIYGLNK